MSKIKISYEGQLRTHCVHENGSELFTDGPSEIGGQGKYFSPTDLFALSLATCMITLMGMAANKEGLELGAVWAEVDKTMVNTPRRHIGKIVVQIYCAKKFETQVEEKLKAAALKCPVEASLHPDLIQEIQFFWQQSEPKS